MDITTKANIRLLVTIIGIVACALGIFIIFKNNLFTGSFVLFLGLWFLGVFDIQEYRVESSSNDLRAITNELCKLFALAQNDIKIFSGSLNPQIYNNECVLYQLVEAKKRGVKIEIVTSIGKVWENFRQIEMEPKLKKLLLKSFVIYNIDDSSKYNHFIIVDSKHIRVENIHKQMYNDERTAYIIYETTKAYKLENAFNNLLKESRLLSEKEILEVVDYATAGIPSI